MKVWQGGVNSKRCEIKSSNDEPTFKPIGPFHKKLCPKKLTLVFYFLGLFFFDFTLKK